MGITPPFSQLFNSAHARPSQKAGVVHSRLVFGKNIFYMPSLQNYRVQRLCHQRFKKVTGKLSMLWILLTIQAIFFETSRHLVSPWMSLFKSLDSWRP